MKKFRKIMAVLVAAIMVVAMTVPAWAVDGPCTINFNSNGGTGTQASITTIDSTFATLPACNYTRANHAFVGWSKVATPTSSDRIYLAGEQIHALEETQTLYAIWDKNDVTITYDSNDGTGRTETQVSVDGSTGKYLTNPWQRDGFSFNGWCTSQNGSGGVTKAAGADIVEDIDVTYYAQWVNTTITITYDPNGSDDGTVTENVTSGSGNAKASDTFTKYESTFTGWNTQANGLGSAYAAGSALNFYVDTTLYAQWSPNYKNIIKVENGKKDETYKLYKILDLNVDNQGNPQGYQYIVPDEWKSFWEGSDIKNVYVSLNDVGSNEYVVWNSGTYGDAAVVADHAADKEAFGKLAKEFATTNDASLMAKWSQTPGADGELQFGNLDNGYYLLVTSYGLAASLASTPVNPIQTLKEKNPENTVIKEVKEGSNWEEENDAAVGETIQFRSTVTLKRNTTNVVYYDRMDNGLTWGGINSVAVFTDASLQTALAPGKYSVAEGVAPVTFTVTFDDDIEKTDEGTPLYISYTATLNDETEVGVPEINECYLKWGNATESAHDSTETFIHSFDILKFDGAGEKTEALKGAKFKLYTVETFDSGNALKLAKSDTDDSVYRVLDMSTGTATPPTGFTTVASDEIVTVANKPITVIGIDNANYWLQETAAPVGFTLPSSRFKVINIDGINYIENISSNKMPETGGMGTTVLYIVGGMLVILAGAYLFFSRKRTA